MNRFIVSPFARLALALLTLLCATQSGAAFRAYVSSTGNDANSCTLPAPCRLLPAALAAVDVGGEIWMLDSANFNTAQVDITKSVSILAIPGAVGSLVATGGGDALRINAAGITVSLRNLVIVHLTSSTNGIHFMQGASLSVTDCDISNIAGTGISLIAPGGRASIRNTQIRGTGNSYGIYALNNVVVVLDTVQVKDHFYGIYADTNSRVTVSNSVAGGNITGVLGIVTGGTTSLVIENSVLSGNSGYGIALMTNTTSDVLDAIVSRTTINHNGASGVTATRTASTTLTVLLNDDVVVDNNQGITFGGTPTVYTRGNNTIEFNNGIDLNGGTLTARVAK